MLAEAAVAQAAPARYELEEPLAAAARSCSRLLRVRGGPPPVAKEVVGPPAVCVTAGSGSGSKEESASCSPSLWISIHSVGFARLLR